MSSDDVDVTRNKRTVAEKEKELRPRALLYTFLAVPGLNPYQLIAHPCTAAAP